MKRSRAWRNVAVIAFGLAFYCVAGLAAWWALEPEHLDLRVLGVRCVPAGEYEKMHGRREEHVFVRIETNENLHEWDERGCLGGALGVDGEPRGHALVWTDKGELLGHGEGSGAWYELGFEARKFAPYVRRGEPLDVRLHVGSKMLVVAQSNWISLAPWREELLRLLPPR